MKKLILSIFALSLILGTGASYSYAQTLTLRWLQPDGDGHAGCGIQEKELNKAVSTLNKSLHKSGVSVELGYLKFTGGQKPEGDKASPLGLWINNKPFESWVQASVSPTASEPCPEIAVEGTTYKVIPSELIIKAGLAAAEQMTKRPAKGKSTTLSSSR